MKIKFLTFVLVLSLVGLWGINSESYAKLSPTPTKLASLDSDNDSYSNFCEVLHKSDPQDKESTPKENITINVPSDVKTIQGAINITIDGDTIAVSQGKYKGNINFNGKSITLTSIDPLNTDIVANTIIEGTDTGSVVTIDSNSALKGFTITSKDLDCRGIYCKDASPTIENCTIIDNQTTESGGGIYSTDNSSPQIINCIITGNKDSTKSKGISSQIHGGTPIIRISLINGLGLVDNTAVITNTETTNEQAVATDEVTPTEPIIPITPDETPSTPVEPQSATIILKLENSDATTTDIDEYTPYAVHFTGAIMADEWDSIGWSKAFVLDNLSDIIEPGEYPDTAEAIPDAVYHTLDGIAIHADTRVIVYSQPNFGGDILLDKIGPAIINNIHWINDSRYNVVMTEDWTEPLQSEFPQSVREWSETDMYANNYLWGHGSFKIIVIEECQGWWYVDDDAPDTGTGTTWDTAFTYLQDALNNSEIQAGDQIRVGQGTYKPDQGDTVILGNRSATFQLINGVTVKGGYAGLDYVELGAPGAYTRDIAHYETILSGDIGIPDNIIDNSYHVVEGSGTDTTAVLDGFTITGGNANGGNQDDFGGGMYNQSGSPTVTGCTFTFNTAFSGGGGMYNKENSNPALTNCTFISNSADFGGGMYNKSGSSPILINCIFNGNAGIGPSYGDAGGIANQSSSSILINCTFSNNIASSSRSSNGGGMANQICPSGYPKLINCTFRGNQSATRGGGLHNYKSNPTLTNCIFWDNHAGIDGDEIYKYFSSKPTITYSNIKGGYTGEGNINVDPLFMDASNPAGADGIFRTSDDGLRLDEQGSPCIDVANDSKAPVTDILGNQRFDVPGIGSSGVLADMGAYETPLNDECQYAFKAIINQEYSGSIEASDESRWYSFTPENSRSVDISLCGSDFSTTLTVYDGCGGEQLAYNDYSTVCWPQSHISAFDIVAGNTYIIRVAGYGSATGNYVLTIPVCELVVNGDFETTITTDWNLWYLPHPNEGHWNLTGGYIYTVGAWYNVESYLQIAQPDSALNRILPGIESDYDLGIVPGREYQVQFDIGYVHIIPSEFRSDGAYATIGGVDIPIAYVGHYNETITAETTGNLQFVIPPYALPRFQVDNVSVMDLEYCF